MTDGLHGIRPLDTHPIPFEQSEINEIWSERHAGRDDPPSVDTAHEEYTKTIAEYREWHVFRPHYPFGDGDVVFWNGAIGEGFRVVDEEGRWHILVNLFADIVEKEGDCRDAEYSSSLRQSGGYSQRCEECGSSWSVG